MTFVFIGNEPLSEASISQLHRFSATKLQAGQESESFTATVVPIVHEKKELEQLQVAISFPTCPVFAQEDIFSLNTISRHLASGWSSRLVNELRVKENLTYWVYANTLNLSSSGYLRILFSIEKTSLPLALKIVEKELSSLRQDSLEPKALARVRYKQKVELLKSIKDPFFLFWWYGWEAVFGITSLTSLQYIEKLESLSAEHIQQVAEKYLQTNKKSIAIIGKDFSLD